MLKINLILMTLTTTLLLKIFSLIYCQNFFCSLSPVGLRIFRDVNFTQLTATSRVLIETSQGHCERLTRLGTYNTPCQELRSFQGSPQSHQHRPCSDTKLVIFGLGVPRRLLCYLRTVDPQVQLRRKSRTHKMRYRLLQVTRTEVLASSE
jgi:hypothetical protein